MSPRLLLHAQYSLNHLTIESNNPCTHGGRGALPSEGGSPSDLLSLSGGGCLRVVEFVSV